jgi:hypothetical protein
MWWLMIPKCFDQFAILHGDYYTSVCLNNPREPEILESREVYRVLFYLLLSLLKLIIIRNGQQQDFNGHQEARIYRRFTIEVLHYGLVINLNNLCVFHILAFNLLIFHHVRNI